MALPHMVEEEDGEGDDLNFQAVVPEDVQNVMTAAEEGDSSALSRAIEPAEAKACCLGSAKKEHMKSSITKLSEWNLPFIQVSILEDLSFLKYQSKANLTSGVDCEGDDGDRPLHIACLYGHLSCVQILLAAGANIEVRDEDGGLPLHDACAGGYKEVVSMLLRAANSQEQVKRLLNAFDVDGDTPLHHAARGNHADVVQLLLDSGANPKIMNLVGQYPADLADPGSNAQNRLMPADERQET